MEINSHNRLLISPSPLLIKTRKLFLELAGRREEKCVSSLNHFLIPSLRVQLLFVTHLWLRACFFCPRCDFLNICGCLVSMYVSCLLVCLRLLGALFPLTVTVSRSSLLSLGVCTRTCLSVCCVGSHVVDLGLKLWVITPIMNHHALFRLSSPKGIDCIMKLSFSLSNAMCPHITLLKYSSTHGVW